MRLPEQDAVECPLTLELEPAGNRNRKSEADLLRSPSLARASAPDITGQADNLGKLVLQPTARKAKTLIQAYTRVMALAKAFHLGLFVEDGV